ncbi:MAG TPA: HAD family hydrolase [candidate division Zixibacteria bacterium]|nr:HAD family hydrolase [candidate division Zixibacteria bacterium]
MRKDKVLSECADVSEGKGHVNGVTTLLFDWDGTLVDSAMSSFLTFQKALAECGVEFTWDQFAAHFTTDWHRMYEAVGLHQSRFLEADRVWKKCYPCVEYHAVAGAHETLSELRNRGYRLGVVTSGSRWRLKDEVEDFGLSGFFDVMICNEDVERKKPHPEGLLKAASLLSCNCNCCAYVGDVPEDILAGKEAGMFTVGVSSQYPTSRKLDEVQPQLRIESISDLLTHFRR